MGCCVSTKQKYNNPVVSDSPHVTKKPLPPPLTAALEPTAPEETVKEVVLSETPITTPPIKQPHSVARSVECSTQIKTPQDRDHGPNGPLIDESVDGSESNFISTMMTTTTRNPIVRRRDEERKEVVFEGMRSHVAPATKRVYSGDVRGANGAAARAAARRPMPVQQRRIDHGGRARQVTEEVGKESLERTRWEGKRMNSEMGNAAGVRKRVPVVGQSRDVAVDISGSGAARGRDGDGTVPEMETESFENPLVSLECFIFL